MTPAALDEPAVGSRQADEQRLAAPSGQPVPALPRLPGLDGLRALAVVAVTVFHLDPRWLPGGFLGVDVFFVVSGFLITTILLREHAATGTVRLRAFWARRARRLLPALLVCVPCSVLVARLSEPDLVVDIGRQVWGALTFTSNWHEIAAGADYFAATSPGLFAHLWSLAVEEQFYLVWPFALLLLLRLVHRPLHRAGVVAAVAGTSAMLMAVRLDPDAPTRVYYGTDTHLTGLMLGAAVAFALADPARAGTQTAWWARHRGAVGAGCVVMLAALAAGADDQAALTFRGGILLASVTTAVLLVVVLDHPGWLRTALECRPARWVGERSYGIYLWHWPVVLVVQQDLPVPPGSIEHLLTRVWAVVITLAAADLSYRFVEIPIRRFGFADVAARSAHRLRTLGITGARSVVATTVGLALGVVAVLATAPDRSSTEKLISAQQSRLLTTPEPAARSWSGPLAGSRRDAPTPQRPRPALADWSMPSGAEVDAIGDSMLVTSSQAMERSMPGIRMDGRTYRRWSEAPAQVAARGAGLRRAVVIMLGTNHGTDEAAVRRTLDAIGPDRMVVMVTAHGGWSRSAADDESLRNLVDGIPNVVLADWHAAVSRHHGDVLQPDGVHPSASGADLMANTVRQALAELSERRSGETVRIPQVGTS
ncbi:MAG: acyltransferase family protein [Dermatophilaceae bacterium]